MKLRRLFSTIAVAVAATMLAACAVPATESAAPAAPAAETVEAVPETAEVQETENTAEAQEPKNIEDLTEINVACFIQSTIPDGLKAVEDEINKITESELNIHINLNMYEIGCFDENGYLFIKDRIKDMINRGGEKVYSLAVEDVIMNYGSIKQAVVFAVEDPLYGEVPGAVIVLEPGKTVLLDELRNYLKKHLAHYKVPVYMEIRLDLPVTANGKVKKYVLKKEFDNKYAGITRP